MFHAKNHKVLPVFDPWEFLEPKRRKLLDESWSGLFRENILKILPVGKLKPSFTRGFGRPSKELYSAVGAVVLQQMHNLTDDETRDQIAFNQQWHYALDITSESDKAKYFCEKTLYSIRTAMIAHRLDSCIFNNCTDTLAKVFGVDTQKQRIDSVQIKSNMRRLGRIRIFSTTIHKFLVNLKRHYSEYQFLEVSSEIVDRYFTEKALGCFSRVKPTETSKTLEQVSRDLLSLVEQFKGDKNICSMHSYKLLERVLRDQCKVVEATEDEPVFVEVKPPKQIKSDSLQNPSDPDAGYSAHKGQGYQVQVMETYTEEDDPEKKALELNLITHVEVEPANAHDSNALIPAIESTQERGLGPKKLSGDALYGSDENCQKAKELGVEVISPVMGVDRKSHGLVSFEFGEQGEIISCAQGHKPLEVKKKKNGYKAVFSEQHCSTCPFVKDCCVKKGKRHYTLNYNEKEQRCAKRRAHEETDEFKDVYRYRAGAEATMSEFDRRTGVKRLRVRGMGAVRFSAVLKAVGLNIFRAAAVKRARTRLDETISAVNSAQKVLGFVFKEQFMKPGATIFGFSVKHPQFCASAYKNTA